MSDFLTPLVSDILGFPASAFVVWTIALGILGLLGAFLVQRHADKKAKREQEEDQRALEAEGRL